MRKHKKITFIVVSVIVVISAALFIYLFIKKDKPTSDLPKNIPVQSGIQERGNGVENGDIIIKAGYLAKLDEKSIGFVGSIKNKNSIILGNENNIETFNLNLTDPMTIITQGNINRKRVALSELKVGQNVSIEYDKNNKNLISININETGEDVDVVTVTGKITINGLSTIKVSTSNNEEISLSIPQTGASFVKRTIQKDDSFMEEKIGLLDVPTNKNVEIRYDAKNNQVVLILVK